MFVRQLIFVAAASSLFLGGITARAQDNGALLDLLVRKKIITDQEAEELRGELNKDYANTSAGKLKMSTPLTEMEIYGDMRVRYEYRAGETASNIPVAPPATGIAGENDWQERKRERYRLRLGIRGTLVDDWFFGLRLETSASPRSTNVTFGDDSNNGPFAKTSDGVFVGQAYFGYNGIRDVTLTAGPDAEPARHHARWSGMATSTRKALAEQWKHTFNLSFGGGTPPQWRSSSKDGKSTAAIASSEPCKMKIDVFANFGAVRLRR